MDKIELIKYLIDKVEEFDKTKGANNNKINLDNFLDYLLKNRIKIIEKNIDLQIFKSNILKGNIKENESYKNNELSIDRIVVQFLTFMSRYAKIYIRKALKNTIFKTMEEFTFTAVLFQFNQLSKMDIIKKNVLEKATGIEITNRLIKKGIIQFCKNNNTKKRQILEVSEKGKIEFKKCAIKLSNDLGIIMGNISEDEKFQLAILLKKLDDIHYPNYLKLIKQ